ncbi:MAG: penicillin-binding protein 2 [Bacillota bacterium]|nr:penicillin-binding protein 2 [Bacillota bacterium]
MQRFIRQQRLLYLALIVLLIGFLLVCRLGTIQLIRHGKYAAEAVRQRAQAVTLDYNRGDILDRHGVSLLGGKREKILVVFPALLKKSKQETVEIVSHYIPQAALPGNPFIALRDVSSHEEELFRNLSSGIVVTEAQRRYGPEALATHVVGHIGPGDGEGKVGLEFIFNRELKSDSPTVLAAVVDRKGNLVEGLGYRLWESRAPHQPCNIVLTIDYDIQKRVEEIMDSRIARGSVVVMDPRNGDILAMASRPNYKQSQLSVYMNDGERFDSFLNSQPFINRSILSYHPGSVFKIVVAAAAIESGQAWLGTRFNCPGHIQVGDKTFRCQGGAHGEITLAEAFAHSCNSVFIELALKLGKDTIYHYASAMGLGIETGIPLGTPGQGGESKGKIPLPDEMPYLGDLALAAIGQGSVETTPLQIARLTSVIANGGILVEPRLVKSIHSKQGLVVSRFGTGSAKRVLSPFTASKIRYMMLGVVEYGTGRSALSDLVVLGGKTGTAETGRRINDRPLLYSWFTGTVPLEESRAVITVFVEEPLRGNASETFKDIAHAVYPYLN